MAVIARALFVFANTGAANEILLAFVTDTLFSCAAARVANNLGVALVSLAGRVVAVLAVTLYKLMGILSGLGDLSPTAGILAKNSVLRAVGTGLLIGTLVSVAYNLLVMPFGGGGDLGGYNLDFGRLLTYRALGHCRSTRCDGVDHSLNLGQNNWSLHTLIHGHKRANSKSVSFRLGLATTRLYIIAWAGQ